ncbi:MAG TPA: peptidase M20, partial [Acidimicrobiaceae bacterium]|nr:peptidase M20 [Acidimicrobiaceae bacterium]
GRMLLPELHVEVPADRLAQIEATAAEFPEGYDFPFVDGARPMTEGAVEQMLAR